MQDRFTDRARNALAFANQEAIAWGHDAVLPEHLMIGLVKEGSGIGARVLLDMMGDTDRIRLALERVMVRGNLQPTRSATLPMSPEAKTIIEAAIGEAVELNHNYFGTEHILLGIMRAPGQTVDRVLKSLNIDRASVRDSMLAMMGATRMTDGTTGAAANQNTAIRAVDPFA